MGHLVVVTGPIASGKTTIAEGLARRFVADGRFAAVADLDDVVEATRVPLERFDEAWTTARRVHGQLVGAWLASGVDLVVALGPIVTADDDELLLAACPEARPRRIRLRVPFAVAAERVTADPARVVSKDLAFLRATHDRFAELLGEAAACDWSFDTSTTSVDDIVETVVRDLPGPELS